MRARGKRTFKSMGAVLAALIMAVLVSACPQVAWTSEAEKPIVVGSKIDTEGALLGNMIVALLKNKGFKVVDRVQTGTTKVVREALISGEIDIYPEYTGNGYFFFSGKTDASVWKDFEKGWETIRDLDKEANDLVWLRPAPANNTWAIAMRRDDAEKANIKTLGDLASYLESGGYFKIAASEEFVSSEAALPAFEAGYGFTLSNDQIVVLSGGNTALTEKAAATRQNGVNAAMAYGTDGQLAALNLVVLEDTKNIQPVYAPAPVVRREVLEMYPGIKPLLEDLFATLDLESLQALNGKIAVNGEDPKKVVQEYLQSKGFFD
ncbi:ABC transporter substrate-binding protein [Thermovirga sp.]|uniref:glycine betaine ABC transporter substrate-binding protein OsmF n=1 Tax=Thermovirga sp. TaxID=2699834 RepID=UPI0025E230BD|nr:ABC transporter substrate-binding protein [Thermovirga sp.]MBO8154690.1 ABC transporter substrate-binding protein [Thermovirga sp.]